MKVTLNWLRKYVNFDWSPEELAERLTMVGVEVEGIEKRGGGFEGVVVAQVLTRDQHPNADKLSVCRVNDGKGERQIVCGAQNFKAGDKVPLILPGYTLPSKPGKEPLTIKVGKKRGVESHGMLCSPQELGLGDEVEGLLILDPSAEVGQPFAKHLGKAEMDVMYDLEITPNRPDLNSVIGIAREISAVCGSPLKLPSVDSAQTGGPVEEAVQVRLEEPELCPRYTARVVRGVKVGPSPDWLRNMLEAVGVRSINNVVDVTNFVMLECGQALHAFDSHLVAPGKVSGVPTIVVRRAFEEEKFTTLDTQRRSLTATMLLIADDTKAIALAGIMGGQNSEISAQTVDVLLESACFSATNIRATSKKLGLHTESSYRFERGSDIGICDWASRRAIKLILETAGGQPLSGVVDVCPKPVSRKQITVRPAKVNEVLGLSLAPEHIEAYLSQLDLEPSARKPRPVGETMPSAEPLAFKIPTFRVDLKREVDLIEEVARLYGVDRIPATAPRGAVGSNPYDVTHDALTEARRLLTGLGLNEAQGQTLISTEAAQLVAESGAVSLANPLSSDMNVLRPSLIPGLLDALRHNLRRKNEDVALFEIGRVFSKNLTETAREAAPIREERRAAIALTGKRAAPFWSGDEREAKFDLYDVKGILEEFLEQVGVRGFTFQRRESSTSLFVESGSIHLGKLNLGQLGQLHSVLAKRYDLRDAVFLAELNLDLVLARRNTAKTFKPLPAFPSIRRDVALLMPEAITHEAILQVIRQAKPANLESTELFDVFRGEHVPVGQKSMAYALTYRAPDRTLTDAEVNTAHEALLAQLAEKTGATIRK
jgi:phenylalanyl-tRNA synthetase beta chain